MNDIDRLIKEQVVPFRAKIIDVVKEQHPYLYSIANNMLAGKKSKAGLQVTEDGKVVGEYTFHLDGIRIESVDIGKLDSGIQHPFVGLIKPYGIMEKSVIEQMVNDGGFISDLINTFVKYLPDITIKFLR